MATTVQWVGCVPNFEVDADGVQIVYQSGNEVFTCRTSRAIWRRLMETGIRALDAYEAEERERRTVVPLVVRGAEH